MYTGEMNVHHSQLAGLLKTAEELRIKGLSDIRWNNKDEPPDCSSGAVTTTQSNKNNRIDKHEERVLNTELKMCSTTLDTKLARINACEDKEVVPQVTQVKQDDDSVVKEKFNLNGEGEDGEWSREASDDEWVDPPADIGSFLHTKLRVDGDNSADEDSDDSVPIAACAQASSSSSTTSVTQQDPLKRPSEVLDKLQRGDMSIENAALALGVNPSKLAAYVADGSTYRPDKAILLQGKRILPVMDEDFTPTAPREKSPFTSPPQPTQSSSWPAIRVASIESLRGTDTTPSPSQLMKTRPDLTIVAAKRDKSDTDT
ncbi:unnamed protein product [Leptidea sinapis]|uniref:Uncharacterized protein n=1 Tax=Leptidea sinapis TaxID=189913 RepID=A0A5E4QPE2_9NEOP|nr:unnamed protein product [Leptidea sinapis]